MLSRRAICGDRQTFHNDSSHQMAFQKAVSVYRVARFGAFWFQPGTLGGCTTTIHWLKQVQAQLLLPVIQTRHRLSWFWTRPFLPSPTLPEAEQSVLTPWHILMPGQGPWGLNQTVIWFGVRTNPFHLVCKAAAAQLCPSQSATRHCWRDWDRLTLPAGSCCFPRLLTGWSLFRARLKEGYFSSITWFLHWGLKNKRKRTQTQFPLKTFFPPKF